LLNRGPTWEKEGFSVMVRRAEKWECFQQKPRNKTQDQNPEVVDKEAVLKESSSWGLTIRRGFRRELFGVAKKLGTQA